MEIFQIFEHNGKILQLATYEPEESAARPSTVAAPVSAPGTGNFTIGPLSLSAEKITAGETLVLTTQVIGAKIAFIYTEILFHDKARNQYYGPITRDYVRAERDKEIHGVCHPIWDATINLTLSLTPVLRILTDSVASAFAFLFPAGYGSTDYQLDGLYTAGGEDTRQRARLTFDSAGEIQKLLVFKEQGGRSLPHALTAQPDDQFSPFVQIVISPTDENLFWQVNKAISTPLTFRDQPFQWNTESPLPGEYLAGVLVQDLDGKLTRQYAPFTIVG